MPIFVCYRGSATQQLGGEAFTVRVEATGLPSCCTRPKMGKPLSSCFHGRCMEAGLGPTTAATWGQLPSMGGPGNPGLDFSASHWGPIIYPQQQEVPPCSSMVLEKSRSPESLSCNSACPCMALVPAGNTAERRAVAAGVPAAGAAACEPARRRRARQRKQ